MKDLYAYGMKLTITKLAMMQQIPYKLCIRERNGFPTIKEDHIESGTAIMTV